MIDKKYVGMSFVFANEYMDHLAKLFKDVDVENYTWYTTHCMNCFYYSVPSERARTFLPDGVYSNSEFKQLVQTTKHYLRLLCLYGVPVGKAFDIEKILVYQDYVQSNAEIALMIADGYVDLYAKDTGILNAIYEAVCRNEGGFVSARYPVELFTPETDSRTGFLV